MNLTPQPTAAFRLLNPLIVVMGDARGGTGTIPTLAFEMLSILRLRRRLDPFALFERMQRSPLQDVVALDAWLAFVRGQDWPDARALSMAIDHALLLQATGPGGESFSLHRVFCQFQPQSRIARQLGVTPHQLRIRQAQWEAPHALALMLEGALPHQ